MKLRTVHTAVLTSLGLASMIAASSAHAGLTGSLGASNMYLWRGTNQTPGGAQVWGELKYTHDSGAFASLWTTPDSADGHETDLYFGYNGKAGEFSYGVTFWEIMYTESRIQDADSGKWTSDLSDTDVQELQIMLGFGPVAFNLYQGLGAPVSVPESNDEWTYITLAGTFQQFTVTFGKWFLEDDDADDYSHLQLNYAATPELAFGVNFTFSTEDDPTTDLPLTEEGPLFYAAYTWNFDLSKKPAP